MQLKDKRNQLTAYGLACGYVELTDTGENFVRLWREHNCYVVSGVLHGRQFYNGIPTLTEARKVYSSIKRMVKGSIK